MFPISFPHPVGKIVVVPGLDDDIGDFRDAGTTGGQKKRCQPSMISLS